MLLIVSYKIILSKISSALHYIRSKQGHNFRYNHAAQFPLQPHTAFFLYQEASPTERLTQNDVLNEVLPNTTVLNVVLAKSAELILSV